MNSAINALRAAHESVFQSETTDVIRSKKLLATIIISGSESRKTKSGQIPRITNQC